MRSGEVLPCRVELGLRLVELMLRHGPVHYWLAAKASYTVDNSPIKFFTPPAKAEHGDDSESD